MTARSRVIAVVNQKGGVGKTTTAVNLAACFAASERRTLLIDLDPQANASSAFGFNNEKPQVYDAIIGGCVMKDSTHPTGLSHLHIVPSGPDLVGAEVELVSALSRERRLEAALSDLRDAYDLIVIDCPPSLSILTLNALTAADSLLIPLQCEYYALEGLARLLETTELVREHLNPSLTLEGIVLTMVDMRNNLSRQVEAEVRGHFRDRVYRTRIPRNVRLSEAPSHGKPIILYDIHSRGAVAYLRLAEEVLGRIDADTGMRTAPAATAIAPPAVAYTPTETAAPPEGAAARTPDEAREPDATAIAPESASTGESVAGTAPEVRTPPQRPDLSQLGTPEARTTADVSEFDVPEITASESAELDESEADGHVNGMRDAELDPLARSATGTARGGEGVGR